MQRKADAYEHYGQAAIVDLLAQVLPEVVRAASEPLGSIDRMTVISTDGASQLTRTVANNVEQSVQVMSDLAGVDITSLISALVAKAAAPNAPIDAAAAPNAPIDAAVVPSAPSADS
jgi:flotillin